MSYETWCTKGFGICVDDIYLPSLSVDKILRLAATNQTLLDSVEDYINQFCLDEGIQREDFTIDDFDDFEGNSAWYQGNGLACILLNAIEKEISVVFADDFNCGKYILYCPSYPWTLDERERELSEEDVVKIFAKYVNILTDVPIKVDYYTVENGG